MSKRSHVDIVLFSLCRQPHPVWSVDGGQSIQVCHWELQTSPPQVVIYVHHPHQGGRATKRISPRLWVGGRSYIENDSLLSLTEWVQ